MAISITRNKYVIKLLSFVTNMIALQADLSTFLTRYQYGTASSAAIANGTTAGRFQIGAGFGYRIGGVLYSKSTADDFWNLSAQTSTTSGQYRAIYLYIDASGAASIGAGSNATTAALAIAALPAVPTDKCVVGTFVAGPSTNFANALSSQGTLYNGWPAAQTLTSESMTLVNP